MPFFNASSSVSRRSKQRNGILPDERVGRGERQAVRLRLTDQHPVEGIAMQRGQRAQVRDGGFVQRRAAR